VQHRAAYPALAVGLSALALAQVAGQGRGLATATVALGGTAAVSVAARSPLATVSVLAASVAGQVLLRADDPVFGSFVALMVGFYALGRRSPPPAVAAGSAAVVLALVLLLVRDPRPFAPVEVVFPLVYFGASFGIGRLARRRERESATALAAARREAVAREQVALAEERARIAREMHDVVAHSVSLLVVQAESAAAVLPSDPDRAAAQLERVADSGRQALHELRRLLGVLRASEEEVAVGPQPTLHDLEDLAASVRTAGHEVALDVAPGLDDVPLGLQLTAYRVAQEALTNAVRHGRAARIAVAVRRRAGKLEVEVVDDGAGPPDGAQEAAGHGLAGMRERVALYGGHLDAGPRAEGGWRVLASAPVPGP